MARWRSGVAGLVLAVGVCTAALAGQALKGPDTAVATPPPPAMLESATAMNALNTARGAAVADGLSTHLALAAGAVERNPLVSPSPGGLLLFTGVKMGLLEAVSRSSMEQPQKTLTLRALSALWGGASVNNVLVALAASGPVAVVAGVASGWWIWARGPAYAGNVPAQGQAAAPAQPEVRTREDVTITQDERRDPVD